MSRRALVILFLALGMLGVCGAGLIGCNAVLSGPVAEFEPTLPPEATTPDPGVRPSNAGPATMGDGTWVVGEDIPAGTYKLNQNADDLCVWMVTKSGSNGTDYVAGNVTEGGRPSVTLKKGHDFQSTSCGTWTKVK